MLSPTQRRRTVEHVRHEKDVSQRRACKVLNQPRATQRYRAKGPSSDQKKLVGRIHELVRKHPRYGYRRIWALLRREGWKVNRKRIYRLWRQEGLKVPKKTRKRRNLGHSGNSCVRRKATHIDHVWCWDFVHDRTTDGQPLKWLAITDEYTRECLALEVNRGITADAVVDVLVELFFTRGTPKHIRSDNGPEFIAEAIKKYTKRTDIETLYVEPGSPWENGYAESFFSRFRDEVLNCEEFSNLAEARWFARRHKREHNEERPHSSLGYQTPSEYAAGCTATSATATLPLQPQHSQNPEETTATITQPVLS